MSAYLWGNVELRFFGDQYFRDNNGKTTLNVEITSLSPLHALNKKAIKDAIQDALYAVLADDIVGGFVLDQNFPLLITKLWT